MDTHTREPLHPAAVAALVLLPPPVLALTLWQAGPEYITIDVNPHLMPLYWVPLALTLAGGAAAVAGGFVRHARRRPGRVALWATGAAGFLMLLPMALFTFLCLYCASAGELDGGWLRESASW
ncbi:hypothetical protein ACFHW2_35405 [Actinomadura sp. LOL_016]|uniref:hypothetical protein n=1 Tax=unclassified Actinomadura TaxID=2626254 RepID=UPI003A801893